MKNSLNFFNKNLIKLFGLLKKRKYLNRIYLWVSITFVVVIMIFSFIVYFSTEKTILKNEYESNKKILQQIKYNVDFMDEMVRNLSVSLYSDPEISTIMFSKEVDIRELVLKINRLNSSVINTNSWLDSIYIYNSNTDTYYSTSNNIFNVDADLVQLIKGYDKIPKMRMIPRRKVIGETSKGELYEYVFSYFMYTSMNKTKQMEGAVIVNVKAEWLLNNINKINMTDKKKLDSIFLLDSKKEIINANLTDKEIKESVRKMFIDQKGNLNEEANFFTGIIKGKKYLITYIYVKDADWIVLRAQSFDKVYNNISQMRFIFIIVTIIFLLFVLVVSATISNRIYKPVKNLVSKISITPDDKILQSKLTDEISYLQDVYANYVDKLKWYKKSSKGVFKNYFLRRLITYSYSVTDEEYSKALEEKEISLEADKSFVICVIKIDNYKEFNRLYNNKERELYKFAIENIMGEVISAGYNNEIIEMQNDHLVLILNLDELKEDFYSVLITLVAQAQRYIIEHFEISITISLSNTIIDKLSISKHYNIALTNAAYRFNYGNGSIITLDKIKKNTENKNSSYSLALERKLAEEIKIGNLDNAKEVLKRILDEVSLMNYNNTIICIVRLFNLVQKIVDELNEVSLESVDIDYTIFNIEVFELDTIQEVFENIVELIFQVTNKKSSSRSDKQVLMAEAVKSIINESYQDSGLCLQQIAVTLKSSPLYLGKLFKNHTHIGISEYINEIRLEKAVDYLENSQYSFNEIIGKIGIENESYFYKLFKKKYGITPKEYRMKSVLK